MNQKGAANLMNAPPKSEVFSSDAKENAGIAALCRGFLTKHDAKRAALVRDEHAALVPDLDVKHILTQPRTLHYI